MGEPKEHDLWMTGDFESTLELAETAPYIVGKFSKVSYAQFSTDTKKIFGTEYTDDEIKSAYDNIKLPARATFGSAGHDFYLPFPLVLSAGERMVIPTGIRVEIFQTGWMLSLVPRSSLGFKYRLQLDNTVGIIDSDYYGAKNEGHIMAAITNDSKIKGKRNSKGELWLERDAAFMQGIFLPYGVAVNGKSTKKRVGGFGSTDER